MKTIIAEGKTIEKDIDAGLKPLGVSQEVVEIKIISEGGLFKKAKVELIVDKEAEDKVIIKEEPKEEPAKETKKKAKAKKEEKTEETVEVVEEKPVKKSKEELMDEAVEVGSKFLTNFFKELNDEVVVTSLKSEGNINYNIKGDKVSTFIGYRGETLNALQYIVNMVVKNAGYRARVILDVENYKAKKSAQNADFFLN